ncbi:hypothetical protein [Herbidospora cretacea]|uniref:hypothetical protein n=1 Tax=Herbidospora cretacea TaxID=28444 RepID=UPI0012DF5D2F|nr:hypothetical protein [Herbidospora cretacea]
MHKLMGALVLTAGLVAVPTAAQAAPAVKEPCWAGSWTVTRATAEVVGKKHDYFVEGGAGIKATFTREGKRVVAGYDFRGSTPLTGGATLTMDGVETFTYTFGGHGPHTHGKVALKPRTGKVGATLERSGGGGKGFSGLLRVAVGRNEDLGAIPRKGTYTCVPNTSMRIHTQGKSGRTLVTIDWELTRS